MFLRMGATAVAIAMSMMVQETALDHFEKKIRPVLASRCYAPSGTPTNASFVKNPFREKPRDDMLGLNGQRKSLPRPSPLRTAGAGVRGRDFRRQLWRKHHLTYDQTKHVVEQTRRDLGLEAPRERRRTVERLDRA